VIKPANIVVTGIDPLISVTQVKRITSLSRSTIDRSVKAGRFPRPVPLTGARRVAWRQSDVLAWIEDPMGWGDSITF
jgi:prophage regulatory protein